MRLFVALAIPDAVAASLWPLQGGVPGARWQSRDQLHLTLRFIGEADGCGEDAIDDALSAIKAPAFALQLRNVGYFGTTPRDLWAGAGPSQPLAHLQKKIESACQRIGLDADRRKFTPHVTLARLKGAPLDTVREFLMQHALYECAVFEVESFCLFSSKLTSDGSIYRIEKEYPLYL
jgi:2''-5'' RNA ligase